ncbi:MAG: immunoglobulin domain-containing protein [Chitinispirillaceae bacterium]|nr:immunoglobulin domain-containing protein [Chitinispirillaceae bacterium]
MCLADTFPDNRDTFTMVDTGDALEGKYVNFDYQFGNPHPGYAGFKFYWDYGGGSFWVESYDSLIFWHKGPLPGHKVVMIWAQGSAGCGTPINYEKFGEFYSSASWTRESFSFPVKRNYGAAPDSQFVKTGLFELRMLIYNDSTISTDTTSPPGNLKIDNMFFFQPPAHIPEMWEQPGPQTVTEGSQVIINVLALGGTGDSGVITYQWIKDGNPLTEQSRRLVIDSAHLSDAGSYTVIATNSLGSDTSDAAILTVNAIEEPIKEDKGCGCGAGTGTALIPPLFFKAMAHRKRKKKNTKTT